MPGSASSPLPTDDPAWQKAHDEAQAAYERLKANPAMFDSMARTESDETGALGASGTGGKLPGYIAADDTNYVPEFVEAVTKPGLQDGQVLEPFRTDFGWHVVQILYHPPDLAEMEKLKQEADSGADFAQLAREYSEDQTTAGSGGDLGWIAKGQLDQRFIDSIFTAPIGTITRRGSSPSAVCGTNEKKPKPGSGVAAARRCREPSASSILTSAWSSPCSCAKAATIRPIRAMNSSSGPAGTPGVQIGCDIRRARSTRPARRRARDRAR